MAAETVIIDLGSDAGLQWQFQPEGAADWASIKVPYGGYRTQGFKCDAGTYRVELAIPASAAGNAVQLSFEAINFGCRIHIGESEASLKPILTHIAPWVPVTVDLTPHVQAGKTYVLVVKAMGRSPSARALRVTNLVWGMGPSKASTTSSTESTMLSTRSTSPPKSACPGVSMTLIFTPP